MKKIMIGFASGVALSMATGALADSPVVQAVLFPTHITIHNGGASASLGSQDEVLNYNNRVYVPLRVLAEKMGAVVDYSGTGQEDSLPRIDVTSPARPWNMTYLEAGNQAGDPFFIFTGKVNVPGTDPVGIYVGIYNKSQEAVELEPFQVRVEIENIDSNHEIVWSDEVIFTDWDMAGPINVIPGSDSYRYWGIRSPFMYWDKKDQSGQPLPAGRYKVQIKPVTLSYNGGKSNEIKPDMHTMNVITIP